MADSPRWAEQAYVNATKQNFVSDEELRIRESEDRRISTNARIRRRLGTVA